MAIDPSAVGAVTEPMLFEWTDRATMLYALGVGFGAAGKIGKFNWAMLLHGSQAIRLHAPLPVGGKLSVVSEVADLQDKGEGKNAIVMPRGRGTDPDSGQLIAETLTT